MLYGTDPNGYTAIDELETIKYEDLKHNQELIIWDNTENEYFLWRVAPKEKQDDDSYLTIECAFDRVCDEYIDHTDDGTLFTASKENKMQLLLHNYELT